MKLKIFFILLSHILIAQEFIEVPVREFFQEYNFLLDFPNRYYVETGASGGGSIERALDAHFSWIRSIDTNIESIRCCRKKFNHRVKLWHGNSSQLLWEMIKDISTPITFWLDAHRFPPEPDGLPNCPLLQELEQIKLHPIKTHTILIDDIRCCGSEAFDYITKEDLIQKVLEINPEYEVYFIGISSKTPILVATLLKNNKKF